MATMQDVLDLAGLDLNDDDKVRWPDPVRLRHANSAIRHALSIRPDLRLGGFGTAITDKVVGDTFPLPDEYQRAVADFIIARANIGERDDAEQPKSLLYMGSFERQLVKA